MFAVIFEVQPKAERWDDYLNTAKRLKSEIERIDGFIDNERFRSLTHERRLLSLSIWRDEKALVRWRTLGVHHEAQERGRFAIFEDYHLRVGEISFDSAAEKDSPRQRFDETEIGAAKSVTISVLEPATGAGAKGQDLPSRLGLPTGVEHDVFESITTPGKLLLLASWRDAATAERWQPRSDASTARHRLVHIIRDYGMFDRREAPQYYPAVER
jgi:heme-degrading monooxygenase HmoA